MQNTTGAFLAADPAHWALEPYIPLLPDDLQARLMDRDELSADQQVAFRKFNQALTAVLHHRAHRTHDHLNRLYVDLDPDNETGSAVGSEEEVDAAASMATKAIRDALLAANYTQLTQEEIEASVGVASHWGVPLHVDFAVFKQLAVYARGDVIGAKNLSRWYRPWRQELVDVAIYQRAVVVFQLEDHCQIEEGVDSSGLHLRMFKNIPKLDVDMLLPGTEVRITWFDRTRIVVPSLGGIGMTIWKIVRTALLVAALSVYSAVILIGLTLAAIGYIVRSVMNYFQTRNRYILSLTRSLYHQKLGTNAGVLYRLLEEAHQQRHCEVMVAYYAMLTVADADVDTGTLSRRRLKRRVERIIREVLSLEIDFDVEETLQLMTELDICQQLPESRYRWESAQQANENLHAWWDAQSLAAVHVGSL